MAEPHRALSVERAPVERAGLLRVLLQEYLVELGAGTDYPCLHLYWEEAGREPYLFVVEGLVVGFALVREVEGRVREMAEFWVAPAHRRLGVGRAAALQLFRTHPGEWVVSSYPGSAAAEMFWRYVLSKFIGAGGGTSETVYRFITADDLPVEQTACGVGTSSREAPDEPSTNI